MHYAGSAIRARSVPSRPRARGVIFRLPLAAMTQQILYTDIQIVEEFWPRIAALESHVQLSIVTHLVERWIALNAPQEAWPYLLDELHAALSVGVPETARVLVALGHTLPSPPRKKSWLKRLWK
jgi:hypothetical protein